MEASPRNPSAAPDCCPLCETSSFEPRDSGRSGLSLWSCLNCSLQFFFPLAQASAEWYAEGYRYRSLFESRELRWNHRRFLKRPASGQSLLDIGCGTGSLLLAARGKGYNVTGLDFDAAAVETARVRLGIDDVHTASAAEFRRRYPDRRFDIVTAFEVIEHVESPAELMRECAQLLRPGGLLVLSTPYRERWPNANEAWDYPPHHLTRWDKAALAFAINRAGCRLVDMETGWTASAAMLSDLTRLGVVRSAIENAPSENGGRSSIRVRAAGLTHQVKKITLTAIGFPLDVFLRGIGATGIDLFAIGRRDPSMSVDPERTGQAGLA